MPTKKYLPRMKILVLTVLCFALICTTVSAFTFTVYADKNEVQLGESVKIFVINDLGGAIYLTVDGAKITVPPTYYHSDLFSYTWTPPRAGKFKILAENNYKKSDFTTITVKDSGANTVSNTNDRTAEDWSATGSSLTLQNKDREALDAYNKAISIDPNNKQAWSGKGGALSSLDRCQEALDAYNKAISIDPNYALGMMGKAVLLNRMGRYEEGLVVMKKAVSIDPSLPPVEIFKPFKKDELCSETASTQTITETPSSVSYSGKSMLDGQVQYKEKLPSLAPVTYKNQEGRTVTSGYAFQGMVILLVSETATDAEVRNAVTAQGGTIVDAIPAVGIYTIQAPIDRVPSLIDGLLTKSFVIDVAPSSPVVAKAAPRLSVLDSHSGNPINAGNCRVESHGASMVYVAKGKSGLDVQTPEFNTEEMNIATYPLYTEEFNEGQNYDTTDLREPSTGMVVGTWYPIVGRLLIKEMEEAKKSNQPVIISLSQGSIVDTVAGKYSRNVCNDPNKAGALVCKVIQQEQLLFYKQVYQTLERASPEVRKNTAIVVAAGNGGVDLTDQIANLKQQYPNAEKSIEVVGATNTDGTIDKTMNFASSGMVYAIGNDVPAGPDGATCSGTSFATAEVANIKAQMWAANPDLTSDQLKSAFHEALNTCSDPTSSKTIVPNTGGYPSQGFVDCSIQKAKVMPRQNDKTSSVPVVTLSVQQNAPWMEFAYKLIDGVWYQLRLVIGDFPNNPRSIPGTSYTSQPNTGDNTKTSQPNVGSSTCQSLKGHWTGTYSAATTCPGPEGYSTNNRGEKQQNGGTVEFDLINSVENSGGDCSYYNHEGGFGTVGAVYGTSTGFWMGRSVYTKQGVDENYQPIKVFSQKNYKNGDTMITGVKLTYAKKDGSVRVSIGPDLPKDLKEEEIYFCHYPDAQFLGQINGNTITGKLLKHDFSEDERARINNNIYGTPLEVYGRMTTPNEGSITLTKVN